MKARKTTWREVATIVVVALLAVFPFSCANVLESGGGESTATHPIPPNSVRVRGIVPSAESLSVALDANSVVGGMGLSSAISHIAAVPVVASNLDIEATEEFEVADDGTFEADLSQEIEDYLLILKDTSLPEAEQVLGYIALPNSNESLLSLPVGSSLFNELNVGSLQFEGNEAVAEFDLSSYEDFFSLTGEELERRAVADDMLKRARNIWLCDHGTWFSLPWTHFHWAGALSEAADQWVTPDSFDTFDGWYTNIQIFDFEASIFTNDDVLNGTVELEYRIPGDQTLQAVDGSAVTGPFTSADMTPAMLVTDPDGPVGDVTSYRVEGEELWIMADEVYSIVPQHPFLDLPVPEGDWVVTANNEELARYDVVLASPVDDEGNIKAAVPAVRFDTEASGRVTGIQIGDRYVFNENSGAYEVVDDATLESLFGISDVRVWLYHNTESGEGEAEEFLGSANRDDGFDSSEMVYEWYYGIAEGEVPEGAYLLTTLFFSYDFQDADMCFTLEAR